MFTVIFSGFTAGLSVGIYCLGSCLPLFVPLMVAERQNLKSTFNLIIEFSLGRLAGYLLFGALAAYLGEIIKYRLIHQAIALITIIGGLTLLIYGFGFLKWGYKICRPIFRRIKIPLILGFVTGVNICPPFLTSLAYIFNLQHISRSLIYFLAFFIGTSFYIIPAAGLAFFSDDCFLQKLARLAGIFVGGFFIYKGVESLL